MRSGGKNWHMTLMCAVSYVWLSYSSCPLFLFFVLFCFVFIIIHISKVVLSSTMHLCEPEKGPKKVRRTRRASPVNRSSPFSFLFILCKNKAEDPWTVEGLLSVHALTLKNNQLKFQYAVFFPGEIVAWYSLMLWDITFKWRLWMQEYWWRGIMEKKKTIKMRGNH